MFTALLENHILEKWNGPPQFDVTGDALMSSPVSGDDVANDKAGSE